MSISIRMKMWICPLLIMGMAILPPMAMRHMVWPLPVHVTRTSLHDSPVAHLGSRVFVARVEAIEGFFDRVAVLRVTENIGQEAMPEQIRLPLVPRSRAFKRDFELEYAAGWLLGGQSAGPAIGSNDVGATLLVTRYNPEWGPEQIDYRHFMKLTPSDDRVNLVGAKRKYTNWPGEVRFTPEEYLKDARDWARIDSQKQLSAEDIALIKKWLSDPRIEVYWREDIVDKLSNRFGQAATQPFGFESRR